MTARHLFALPFVVLAACTGAHESAVSADAGAVDSRANGGIDGAPVAPHACDPLNAPSKPLALANLLGAGRHADGTYYVVDDGGRDHMRAFVSMGSVLQREVVLGSGYDIALTVSVDDPQVTIKIEGPSPHPSRMGVYRGALAAKTFDIGTQGDELTVVDLDALSGFTPMDINDNVVIEYNASVPDGRRFFVVHPRVDVAYEDFRPFFGTADAMRERALIDISRTKSGTTSMSFMVDDEIYRALIPSPPPIGTGGTPTLTPDGAAAMPLTMLSRDKSAAAGLAFECTK